MASACLASGRGQLGATPGRVFALPNGIAGVEAWLDRRSKGTSCRPGGDGRLTALLYTRFAGVRVEAIAAIWREVVASLPDARLAVVGRGLAGEETRLAGLAPNVDVLGWAEPANMPALFGRMSVALVPWADTPANRARNSAKVLELMAAGLPLVAYRVGELPSTLDESGVLVSPGEQAAFAQAVVALSGGTGRALGPWVRPPVPACRQLSPGTTLPGPPWPLTRQPLRPYPARIAVGRHPVDWAASFGWNPAPGVSRKE